MSISKINRSTTKAFAVVDARLDKPKGALYVVQPHAALAIFGTREEAEGFTKTLIASDLRHARIVSVEVVSSLPPAPAPGEVKGGDK